MRRQTALVITGAILLLTATSHAGIYTNPADINNDHRVDIDDLSDFAAAYLTEHTPDPNWNPACDIADPANGDVNEIDALALAAEWLWSGAAPDPNQWAYIPSGEFLMGDHFNEGFPRELPVHAVYVDSFYMSRYEVTNQQYCDYLNSAYPAQIKVVSGRVYASTDTGNSEPYCDTTTNSSDSRITWNGSSFGVVSGRESHPMVQVSWYGAVAYCNYYGYRLPTEAQWEYAARGGLNGNRYPWGNTINSSLANYYYYINDTTPVGSYPAGVNGYGLYDMAGNVYEWCNDWVDGDYYDVSPYDNPQGPASSPDGYRVLRGGGWGYYEYLCRVTLRYGHFPDYCRYNFGFRIVLDF